MQEGSGEFQRYGKLPPVLPQLANRGSRTFKTDSLRVETLWYWELNKTRVLAYFDQKADHVMQVDGSMKGLGLSYCKNIGLSYMCLEHSQQHAQATLTLRDSYLAWYLD